MQICHRDLKLENTLLDGSPAPRLKICDFGYSKSSLLHSRPKSTVRTSDKYFDKAPSTYSQEMIDELRERWISYVSRYNQPFNDDDEYTNSSFFFYNNLFYI
ncbi:hypothetical protein RND81_10G206600 [Saponaria officinalis]|uniref:Protein kinase domain-containing protein n=1 Tax=Saponaria officinalis TaxID=3572 RepID=A0AAW1I6Z3_SAPOF